MTTPNSPTPISPESFVKDYVGAGGYVIDFNIAATGNLEHGELPHLMDGLILDEYFSESLSGVGYPDVAEIIANLESTYPGLGVEAYKQIFDPLDGSLGQPEVIWPMIKKYFGW